MAPSDSAILFGLNHTTNRYYGASLADQLGNSCWRAKPKFFFPPDWVAEKSRGPAEVAVFAVTYCDDPETLGAIARRDKRIGVLKALAGNKHLTRDDYAFMVGRVRDTEHRDAIESTRRRLHLDETAIARVEFEALTPVPSERARFDRTIAAIDGGGNAAGLLGALFEDEARHVKHCAVDMYFKETYIASTNDELWSQSRRSPVEVLRLYTGAAQAEVLTGFVKVLDPSKAPASLLGLDLVEVLVEHGITPPDPQVQGVAREIFSPEALSFLLERGGWDSCLSRQILSEQQFAALLARGDVGNPSRRLWNHLHGSHDRLVTYLEARCAEGQPSMHDGEIGAALGAISDHKDPLIFKMVSHGTERVIKSYIRCELKIEIEGTKELVEPTLEQVLGFCTGHASLTRELEYLLKYSGGVKLSEAYKSMLIDNVDGLAFKLFDNSPFEAYTYKKLMDTGAGEERILEVVDELKTKSLASVIATLEVTK